MTSVDEYALWQFAPKNDPYRLYIVEVDYTDGAVLTGHGRSATSGNQTLDPVQSLTLEGYTNDLVEILFAQPVQNDNYGWTVWIDGELIQSISEGGVFSFSGENGRTYQIAVSSDRSPEYSAPFVLNYTHTGQRQTVTGSESNWSQIGAGEVGTTPTRMYFSWPDGWVSDEGNVYDAFLSDDLFVEKDLFSFNSIGDFKAVNASMDFDWTKLAWRGQRFALLHGDTRWTRDQFFPLAESLIGDVRLLEGNEYRFDVLDSGQEYRGRSAANFSSDRQTLSVALSRINAAQNFPILNLLSLGEKANYWVSLEVDENTDLEATMRLFARSVNATFRIGNFTFTPELVAFEQTIFSTITDNDIVKSSVRHIDSTPAYKTVNLVLANGDVLRGITSASTGDIKESITIDTVLEDREQGIAILSEYVQLYSNTRNTYEIDMHDTTGFTYTNKLMDIDSEDLKGVFRITNLRRYPMQKLTKIEVEEHYIDSSAFTASAELVTA